MSSTTITILALGVISFVLYQVFRVIRRQLEAAAQVRQRLGFVKVETVEPALIARIAAIMSPQTGKVKVTKVHKRDQGSHVLYDCYVDHEKNSDSVDHCSVLVGRNWRLPSLRLAPRVGGEGKGWSILNKLTLLAVRQGGYEEVKFENQPEFAKKYTALSRTPQEVAGRIPGEVWRDLAASRDAVPPGRRGHGYLLDFRRSYSSRTGELRND